jgi:protein-tyrosine phosphatase
MESTAVCFVCLGNICRSPTAEGLLLAHLRERGLEGRVRVDSAGTAAYHVGERPDPRTLATARAHGVELPSRGRQFTREDFARFDHVVAMDAANAAALRALAPDAASAAKISLLRGWADGGGGAGGADVPDPYYGGADGFEEVFEICRVATLGLLEAICGR